MFLSRATSSSKGTAIQLWVKKDISQILNPKIYDVATKKFEAQPFPLETGFQGPLIRCLHVTNANRDLESGLRAIGTGAAATGVIGPGIGVGVIFGNLLSACARNPSISNKIFANAVMGAAFCESLGLFAIAVAFLVMP